MPRIDLPALGGMVTDAGRMKPGDSVLAENVTWAQGPPEGRRGMRRLYAGASTLIDGSVTGIYRYMASGLGAFIAVAGWDSGKGLTVSVYAGRNRIASQSFALPVNFTQPVPIFGAQFADSLWLATPGDSRLIRVRFEAHAVTIAEATLVDRLLVPLGAQDDPGPYYSRLQRGGPLAAFQGRLFMAGAQDDPDVLFWSNIGDALGWSGVSYLRIREGGAITALAVLDRYLFVFKERATYVVRGGFTGSGDTVVDVVDTARGSASHRGSVVAGDSVLTLSQDGVLAYTPGQPARVLSDDVTPFLRGRLAQPFGAALAHLVPDPQSFRDAPGAWLPSRREVYFALSTGLVRQGHALARDLLLVGHLGGDRPRWSLWRGGSSTVPLVFQSLLSYVDEDGLDTLLVGMDSGQVNLAHVSDRDQGSDGTLTPITSRLTLGPVLAGAPARRTHVRAIEVETAETARFDGGQVALRVEYQSGESGGMYSGATRNVTLAGRGTLARSGSTLPLTLRTAPLLRRVAGLRAVSVTDAWHLAVFGATPMPPVYRLALYAELAIPEDA